MGFSGEKEVAMKEKRGSYVPPSYIPLGQAERSDSEAEKDGDEVVDVGGPSETTKTQSESSGVPQQWSSGICACCDDLQSCKQISASILVSY